MNLVHTCGGNLVLLVTPDEIGDFCHMVDKAVPIDFTRELREKLKKEGLL